MKYLIKETGKKGKGLFANKNIKKGELILSIDLSKKKSYTLEQVGKLPDHEHADHIGKGRYVISHHPYSYINHSCEPNILVKHLTISKSKFYAMKDIKKGEELTYDYGVNALEGFEKEPWIMNCKCKSKNCRKKISGSFFKQSIKIQKQYYKYLPLSIKRKYKKQFENLK